MASAITTIKRFEFVGGGSDKFWEITTRGAEIIVRFGRNGAQGQTTTKTFPDAAAARAHADKLIRQKTGKGYVAVA
jgi:predicted DNA-binding WGR domain protein